MLIWYTSFFLFPKLQIAAYALHSQYESPEAAAMAARAVRNLSCIDEIAAKMVQEGAIEGLIELLKRYALSNEYKNHETTDVSCSHHSYQSCSILAKYFI
jgi:hypothetical protein